MRINKYLSAQLISSLLIRIMTGWYLLYEGGVKRFNPAWPSGTYILDSEGLLSGSFYYSLAASREIPGVIDIINE